MVELIALVLILLGIYFILRGLFKPSIESYGEKKKVRGGGVILIGPIPIVFGELRFALYALLLAIVLAALSIIFILL
jgi:uncharacterized protein (TIGR00304 family)